MGRAGRKDRGLLSKRDTAGKTIWYVRLWHEGKERRFGSFKTKTEARDFYEKAKQEQKLGRFFPERYQHGGYAKLQDVIDGYLAAFTGRSRRDEARFAKKWLLLFPGARLNALTPAALERARAQLSEEGRTPQTVNRYMGFLRRVLNKAVRDGLLGSNPVARIKMFKEPQGKTRFLTVEEEKELIKALGPAYGSWARLAILTGMRQMEQFSLKWSDVDPEQGVITLCTTKSGGVQYVHLNDEAKGIIEALKEGNKSVCMFPSANPESHVDPRNFYRRVYLPAVREARLDGVSWHTLRHTFASRLAMGGATESTIAALLRHSGTALVRRYAHLSPSHLQEAIEKVARFGRDGSHEGQGRKEDSEEERTAAPAGDSRETLETPIQSLTVTGTGTGQGEQ